MAAARWSGRIALLEMNDPPHAVEIRTVKPHEEDAAAKPRAFIGATVPIDDVRARGEPRGRRDPNAASGHVEDFHSDPFSEASLNATRSAARNGLGEAATRGWPASTLHGTAVVEPSGRTRIIRTS